MVSRKIFSMRVKFLFFPDCESTSKRKTSWFDEKLLPILNLLTRFWYLTNITSYFQRCLIVREDMCFTKMFLIVTAAVTKYFSLVKKICLSGAWICVNLSKNLWIFFFLSSSWLSLKIFKASLVSGTLQLTLRNDPKVRDVKFAIKIELCE